MPRSPLRIERDRSRRLALFALLLVALALPLAGGCSQMRQATGGSKLTERQRELNLESFNYVSETLRTRNWDPTLGGVDWDSLHAALEPEVAQAKTMPEARQAMQRMTAALGQSHCAIMSADIYADLRPDAEDDAAEEAGAEADGDGAPGFDVRVIGGQALVTAVQEGSPAERAGVRPGWEILEIGEREIPPMLASLTERFADETYAELLLSSALMRRFDGAVGSSVAVTFRTGTDEVAAREITLVQPRGLKARFGNLPELQVWIETERLPGDIGYIAFNYFLDPLNVMRVYNEAMNEYLDAAGVIIDVRGNEGGLGAMAMGMASWFFEEKGSRLGTMYTREGEVNFVVSPRPRTFDGPVAVLVDGLSASTSEIFAGGLQDLGRVRIFGSRTAGAALPSVIEKLPNGDGFQYPIANYISEGGEPLEGRGVMPDVKLVPSRRALLQGRDPAFDAAVAWIGAQRATS